MIEQKLAMLDYEAISKATFIDSDTSEFMEASIENRASSVEMLSPIPDVLFSFLFIKAFKLINLLIFDLLAYRLCNLSKATLMFWQSWTAHNG